MKPEVRRFVDAQKRKETTRRESVQLQLRG